MSIAAVMRGYHHSRVVATQDAQRGPAPLIVSSPGALGHLRLIVLAQPHGGLGTTVEINSTPSRFENFDRSSCEVISVAGDDRKVALFH